MHAVDSTQRIVFKYNDFFFGVLYVIKLPSQKISNTFRVLIFVLGRKQLIRLFYNFEEKNCLKFITYV